MEKCSNVPTCAGHAHILRVTAVVGAHWVSATVEKGYLSARTVELVQHDLPCSLTKPSTAACGGTSASKPELSASNVGVIGSKGIITDCSPGVVVADLHATFLRRSTTDKTDGALRTDSYDTRYIIMCNQ